jgi:hypothetical protein
MGFPPFPQLSPENSGAIKHLAAAFQFFVEII